VQQRAACLARAAGAPLHLLHVLHPARGERAERSAYARLHLAAANLREECGIAVEASLARGHVASTIVARARALEPSYVVMGSRHAQRVQRRIEAPVLVASGPAFEPYRRVVFACDLTEEDAGAAALARSRFPQARLHALHVFQWHAIRPLRLAFVAPEVLERYRRHAQRQAAAALRRFAAAHGVRSDISLQPPFGDVAEGLRAHAGILGADLLVLSPERSWLKSIMGASVTRRLLAAPPCDVLLAPRGAGPGGLSISAHDEHRDARLVERAVGHAAEH
jgi:nucleotide-binding universal stress UspA family protein